MTQQFSIPEQRQLKLRNFQNRSEHHGQDWVYAFTAHLRMTASNEVLDLLDPALRQMFWVDGKTLRTHKLKGPSFAITGIELVGWKWVVDRATSPIVVEGCTVVDFEFQPKDDGIAELSFKVNGHCPEEATRGILAGLINHDIGVQLLAPQAELDLEKGDATDLFTGGSGADGEQTNTAAAETT